MWSLAWVEAAISSRPCQADESIWRHLKANYRDSSKCIHYTYRDAYEHDNSRWFQDHLKTGRRRPETSWTQISASSEIGSLSLLIGSPVRKFSYSPLPPPWLVAGIPSGLVCLICAWLSAIANNALAAYLCDGVKFDEASTIKSDQQKKQIEETTKSFQNAIEFVSFSKKQVEKTGAYTCHDINRFETFKKIIKKKNGNGTLSLSYIYNNKMIWSLQLFWLHPWTTISSHFYTCS